MKKILLFMLIVAMVISLSGCGLSKDEETELVNDVSNQCYHIIKLAFDGTGPKTKEPVVDIDSNTWTVNFVYNDLSEFQWQGNGSVVLNMETSMNNLSASIKNTFDSTKLKSEDYSIVFNFVDQFGKIYYTSENGLTTYSAWG